MPVQTTAHVLHNYKASQIVSRKNTALREMASSKETSSVRINVHRSNLYSQQNDSVIINSHQVYFNTEIKFNNEKRTE
jgi:flagellar basal body P-ring protein FlgI